SAMGRRLNTYRLMEMRSLHESSADDEASTIHDNTHQRAKINDRTLKEKVAYFANTPKHMPKMKCTLKRREKTYRRIVTEFTDNTVIIQQGTKHTPETIAFADIEEVHMLGL